MTDPSQLRHATCRVCMAAFDPSPTQRRYYDHICKPCATEQRRAYRDRLKAAGKTTSGARPQPEARRAYYARYMSRPEVRERERERWRVSAAVRDLDPQERFKESVRKQARHAVAAGKLRKGPCEVCGCLKVDAHHDDYFRPLDVRWLCRVHHHELHASKAGAAA